MLIQMFRQGITKESVIQLLLFIPILLISLSIHEYAHAYAAYRCGDMTARNFGRLTLNPAKHLDPIGTAMMLFFGFGYAKPVPINTRNFKKPRRDICIVSAAGPVSNIILAFIGLAFYRLLNFFLIGLTDGLILSAAGEKAVTFFFLWTSFAYNFVYANLSLAVFNLIPIPPLDGSRLLTTVLPYKISYSLSKYEQYIMFAVILLLYFGALDGVIIFFRDILFNIINSFLSLFPIFY